MSEQDHEAGVTPPVPSGWFQDPWDPTRQRYWHGESWSTTVWPRDAPPAPDGQPASLGGQSASPAWIPATAVTDTSFEESTESGRAASHTSGTEVLAMPAPERRPRLSGLTLGAVLLVFALVVASGTAAIVALSHGSRSNQATISPHPATPLVPVPTTPPTTAAPATPEAAALAGLAMQQADIPSGTAIQTIPGGDQVNGQTTLDLCNGTFPSEALRVNRLQTAAADSQGSPLLSTEAVFYQSAAATSQAFSELRSVVAQCPSTPVVSPVGDPTVTTKFNAAPDASWPQLAGVDRLAYDFETTDATGTAEHSVAVYLRRGRALMGVYFQAPDNPQVSVRGQTTIPGIVNVFAMRLAALPLSPAAR